MTINDYVRIAKVKVDDIFRELKSNSNGLDDQEAKNKRKIFGTNSLVKIDNRGVILKFLTTLTNPLVVTLVLISIISYFFGQKINALAIIFMAVASAVLTFIQEYNASKSVEKLKELVKVRVKVKRNNIVKELLIKELVPGDIILLSAGNIIAADVRFINSKDLFVNQAALNGESFPVKKNHFISSKSTSNIFDLESIGFMGSSIVSGFAEALVIKTGTNTEFGRLTSEITKIKKETSFDRGIRDFTWLMIRLIFFLIIFIFLINSLLKHDFLESLLFALAVAVGLTPELLPVIVTVNLSKGAIEMAKKKVIIKELDSIQNFGAMDILCVDKTGTLTINEIILIKHSDITGKENEDVLRLAYLNSYFQSGMENLLDKAIVHHKKFDVVKFKKIDEIPYDFERKKLSVILREGKKYSLVSKGAPEEILKICKFYQIGQNVRPINFRTREKINEIYKNYSQDGLRVLTVAYKNIKQKKIYSKHDERDLILAGFVAFYDPPKSSAANAIQKLEELNISLKVISGDNELVIKKVCEELKMKSRNIITGYDIDKIDDKVLDNLVEKTNIFARIDPLQKERIIKSLQRKKHIVGYLGDGINDAPSIRTSDVGISVNNATDVAKETASIILLEKSLMVLADVVVEGRRVFGNIIKYIKMGASSNFGNMFSMAGASIILPFLPMTPAQILLNNFLYDTSQLSIPTDNVDKEYLIKPKPWNIDFIKKFILYIGPLSSIFDFLTFGIMWFAFGANASLFHTGWFVESLTTQVLVVHIIRTDKIPFVESKPSKALLFTTLGIIFLGWIIPYTGLGKLIGFSSLPASFFVILVVLSFVYLLLVQWVKKWFNKKFGLQ